MSEDHVVLWRDGGGGHELCFEIVQIGEGEFELRILCDGRLWLEEDSTDLPALIARARQLRADVHPRTGGEGPAGASSSARMTRTES